MTYDWTQHLKSVETKQCPRCKKQANKKGFKRNPDPNFDNEICWKCYRQVIYHQKQNKVSVNILGITVHQAKLQVFNHYGRVCNCCGETEEKFLEVDHTLNDGAEHRKMLNGMPIYIWIINNNFPSTFQILCANCNRGKFRNGGVCPHKNLSIVKIAS